jgi:NIPSNAP
MTNYALSQIQLKYGPANLARFRAAMPTVQKVFESQNMMLVASTVTTVGPLYEVFNLWQIEDEGHLQRVLHSVPPDDPEVRAVLAELAAIVEHEQLRFLESLPFGYASRRP